VDKEKTTAHAVYMLDTPVHRNQHSKQSPQRLFAALESIYGVKLGADSGYSGLVMKTPWYENHSVYMPDESLNAVSLTEMADFVDFSRYNAEIKALKGREKAINEAYSESRNVQVFDMARKKAYSAIRNFWGCQYDEWEKFCLKLVEDAWGVVSAMNTKNAPYLISEMKASAKSIAKWTWRNVTPASFELFVAKTHQPQLQRARQAKSVASRLIKTQDKRDQAIELSRDGMKQVEIAQMLGVTDRTIRNWLAMHQDEQ
jgi:hypothetical protein